MDFVHDQLAAGPKLRVLTIVDTFSRYSPAVVPRFRFRAPDVIDVLERVCAEVGTKAFGAFVQAIRAGMEEGYQRLEGLEAGTILPKMPDKKEDVRGRDHASYSCRTVS
jgi:hypothetical protein